MSSPTIKSIVDTLKSLTLLEVSELVTEIEETFDVDASAPRGGFMMPPTGNVAASSPTGSETEDDDEGLKRKAKKEEKEPEPDTFNLILKGIDESKRIVAYKLIREYRKDLTIPKVKEFLGSLPQVLVEKQSEEAIKQIEEKLKPTNADFERVLA